MVVFSLTKAEVINNWPSWF